MRKLLAGIALGSLSLNAFPETSTVEAKAPAATAATTAACPLEGYVPRRYHTELATLSPWTAAIDDLPYPADYSPATVAAWRVKLFKAEQETYRNLRIATLSRKGQAALSSLATAMIGEWHLPKQYPPGLSPVIWEPIKGQSTTIDGFFQNMHPKGIRMSQVTRTLLTSVVGRTYLVTGPEVVDELKYRVRLAFAFRAFAESQLGESPDDFHFEGLPPPDRPGE